jgi:polyisoprenoid-binding protein YceI
MTWTLDKAHLDVGFSAKHMMVATVKGHFAEVDAEIEIDEEQPERSSVVATVQAASLSTGQPDRDAHLRSPDFFDVERHPEITFRSRRVSRRSDGDLDIAGDLTIREVTQPIVLSGEFTGPVIGMQGGRHLGFSLNGEIDREAFGLTWNMALEAGGVLVGRKIKLHVDAEVVQAAGVAAAAA